MEPPGRLDDTPDISEISNFPTQPILVPTMIMWNYEGHEVAIEGSFDNWTTRHKLQRTGRNFTVVKLLPPGVYQYKFIVDGEWKYDPNQSTMFDEAGNMNNVIEVREFVPENLGGLAGFDPPPSPCESYNCAEMEDSDFSKEPPNAPIHLQYTLLNVPTGKDPDQGLPRPWHVTLNHIYVQRGSPNVNAMVLGTTQRFQSKYVTTVMYKPKRSTQRQSSLQH